MKELQSIERLGALYGVPAEVVGCNPVLDDSSCNMLRGMVVESQQKDHKDGYGDKEGGHHQENYCKDRLEILSESGCLRLIYLFIGPLRLLARSYKTVF